MSYADFLDDTGRFDVYLFEISAYRRSDGATVTLYLSTAAYSTEPWETPANQPYQPLVEEGYSYVAPAVAVETFGLVDEREGAIIEVRPSHGDVDSWRDTYALSGRSVTIRHGGLFSDGERLPHADARLLRVAEIESAMYGLESVKLKLREQGTRFDHPVEDRVLWGGQTALGFDGSAVFVDFGTYNGVLDNDDYGSKLADITGNAFIEAQVYLESLASTRTIYSSGPTTARPLHLEITTSGQLKFVWSKGGVAKNYTTTTLTAITTKCWHDVFLSIFGTTAAFRVYNQQTNAWDVEFYTHADVASRDAMTSGNIYAGREYGGTNYFSGQMAKLVIRAEGQSEAQIKERFDRQLQAFEIDGISALRLYAKFDDAEGGYAADSSNPNGSSNQRTRGELNAVLTPITTGANDPSLACREPGSTYGNAFTKNDTEPTFQADGWAAGDIGVSSGWSHANNNGTFHVVAIDPDENTRHVMRIDWITLVREPYESGGSPGVLSKYVASGRWYPTLMGYEDDTNQPTLPNVFGKIEGWAPVLVDPVRFIYQVHSDRIESFDAVREGGKALDLNAQQTDLKTFLDTIGTTGSVDLLNYAGGSYFRLNGKTPYFPITVDLKGCKRGGTYVKTAATIFRRIVTTRGPKPLTDPGDLNTTSFSAVDSDIEATISAATNEVGIVVEAGRTIRDVANSLLSVVGVHAVFERETGDLAIYRLGSAAAETEVGTYTEADIVSLEPNESAGPIWLVEVPFRKCWNPLGTADLSLDIKGTAAWRFYQEEYRRATASDKSVLTEYPLARELRLDTGSHSNQNAAHAEASRRLALYRDEPQMFRALCRSRAIELDLFDVIILDYGDQDRNGNRQNRLGTSSTTKFWVLGVEEFVERGEVSLILWRDNSTA